MSRTLQFKRYANTVVAGITGAAGEIIIDTTNRLLTIHDGITPGGFGGSFDSVARFSAAAAQTKAQDAYNYANTIVSDTQIDQTARTTANTASNNIIVLQSVNNSQNARMTIIEGVDATQNTNIAAAAQTFPQNAQTVNYVIQSTDAGKHIYYTQSSNTILYVPWSSNVGFSTGTTIMVISRTSSIANVTISPNTGVTMYLAGNTTSASRNVTAYGMATLIQVAANTWFIDGTGVA
jgi:hypothetical protein